MLSLLRRHFGYDSFRPLQEEIITHVLAGQNALVLMPTGGGKSLTFQLPALKLPGLTLVVSPLIALMKDQVDQLRESGVAVAFLNSTLQPAEAQQVEREALAGTLKLLYIAPERIATPSFQALLRQLTVSLLAIDEAHCISEWGHDFRPDYRNLKMLRRSFPKVPVIALTATATPRVQADICEQLDIADARVFVSSFNRANLSYVVRPKKSFVPQVLELLTKYRDESVIIYCFSRSDTEELAKDLREHSISAEPYHAGLAATVRSATQEKFIRDEVHVICATIAFGMGIDKPDVRLVIHADLPKSIEGYYQETGRAGRDGLPAECILFYSYGDRRKQDFFIRQITDAAERQRAELNLTTVINYGELVSCRRHFLLSYFGEQPKKENCGGCDVCLSTTEEVDATELTQKILSAVIRTGERFGAAHIIAVLTGELTPRLKQYGHERLPTFGAARDVPAAAIHHAVQHLVARELLTRADGQYPTIKVSASGKKFLSQQATITLPKFTLVETARKKDRALELTATATKLFDQLRALRKQLADERSVPPFVIFGDRTLIEMARHLPQSLESLGRISGVGEYKLATFGAPFLAAITEFASARHLTESTATPTRQRTQSPRSTRTTEAKTYRATEELVQQKVLLAEIATRRGFTLGTIMSHLEKLLAAKVSLDITYLRPPKKAFTEISAAFQALGTTALGPVHKKLSERYSYDELRLVRLFITQSF